LETNALCCIASNNARGHFTFGAAFVMSRSLCSRITPISPKQLAQTETVQIIKLRTRFIRHTHNFKAASCLL
jgi:hypothetical protein